MKKVEIEIDFNKQIKVKFSNDPFSHRDLKNMKRALDVEFRRFHYNLIHPKENKDIEKT